MPLDFEEPSSSVNLAGKFYFLSKSITSKWIIDSGATDHMCNSLDSFIFTQKIHNPKHSITIPDGRKVVVDLYGDVVSMEALVFKDVLYVPTFQFNLISVHKLCTDICTNVILLMVSASLRTIQRQELLVNCQMDSTMLIFPHQHLTTFYKILHMLLHNLLNSL